VLYTIKEVAGLAMVVLSNIPVRGTLGISMPLPFGLVKVLPVLRSNKEELLGVAPVELIPTFWL